MTRYLLPEALGGGEVTGQIITTGISVGVGDHPVLLTNIQGVGQVSVPLAALTPATPPEPPLGSAAIVRMTMTLTRVFMRSIVDGNDGWRAGGERGEVWDWTGLHELGQVQVLVPDPLAEAPELPWSAYGLNVAVNGQFVAEWPDNNFEQTIMRPAAARAKGLALLRAANELESQQ